ncbi:MAG: hypothetical protein GC164_11825 [Phycisphaera sp.]|nr:hypothetical protein [Phycisphaera sp.]
MTVYETTNVDQVRMWCEANGYWPGCLPGQPDRIRIGGSPFGEPEELELLDWDDWGKAFNERKLKFVYDPNKAWCDLQSRNTRPD